MEFTPWQLGLLQARLAAYRLTSGRGGAVKSWLDVTQEILDSEATDLWIAEDDDELPEEDKKKLDANWPIRQEQLRKFVEGENKKTGRGPRVPKDERVLEAVCDFLIDVGYLRSADFEVREDRQVAAHGLVEYFYKGGHNKENMRGLLPGAGGLYYAFNENEGHIDERAMRINTYGEEPFFSISEIRRQYRNPGHLPFAQWRDVERKHHMKVEVRLSGWGVVSPEYLFFIVLCDEYAGLDHHAYVGLAVSRQSPTCFVLLNYNDPRELGEEDCEDDMLADTIYNTLGSDVFSFRHGTVLNPSLRKTLVSLYGF